MGRVYPRVCGGSAARVGTDDLTKGLSPRVRGIPSCKASSAPTTWSIPACAGDPPLSSAPPRATGVYPRVCGGSFLIFATTSAGMGLSPRVRGIPSGDTGAAYVPGSIPACAGDPSCPDCAAAIRRVYPRVCGGSKIVAATQFCTVGLSPRVRGILVLDQCVMPGPGSIPACAGDPHAARATRWLSRVYPRVCGGSCVE